MTVLNPRRDDWDSSWVQSIDNPQFNEQVNWELDGIEAANIVVFYFDPKTQSPITLYELGAVRNTMKTVYVVCPEGYFRKGNVDIICKRNGFQQFNSLEELAMKIIDTL